MNKPKIITHSGGFHTDDVFAVATLKIILGEVEIVRTREEEIINGGDYVVDVGNIYNAEEYRFDHHQRDGAGNRENGIPYAAFGLVWKHFGLQVSGSEEIATSLDKKLVQPIDAGDNGLDISTPQIDGLLPYSVGNIVSLFKPTWKEAVNESDNKFLEAVLWAEKVINREVVVERDLIEARKVVIDRYNNADDKSLIVFNESEDLGRILISSTLANFKDTKYFVFPNREAGYWQVVAVNNDGNTYEIRNPFPDEWRGLRGPDLEKVTSVPGSIFCHRTGFMCVVQSREGALNLAKLALALEA